ncbi:MAG: tetratricopeptide repeat protein [Gemmataceae bacterium]|nr:tetratricopeptide repeat protein [Gemmataceae bacterium]
MTDLENRIAQFRKMASDDPDNELGHYRLGQLLMENKQFDQAVESFKRTLELSPQFSKVFQLLGKTLLESGKKEEAATVLKKGWGVADERGDKLPRDEMGKMLVEMGESLPESKRPAQTAAPAGGGGFPCKRPGCQQGSSARKLPAPPFKDEFGSKVFENICADCWTDWLRNYSIKVINEMRLDLSTERGQAEYDRHMLEFLGLEN